MNNLHRTAAATPPTTPRTPPTTPPSTPRDTRPQRVPAAPQRQSLLASRSAQYTPTLNLSLAQE